MKEDNITKVPADVITSDTDNATIIPVDEAPPDKRNKFKRLREYNTGRWNGPKREETKVRRREDDLHRFDAIASSVELNKYQKSRGRTAFDELSFPDIGGSVDEIAFAVCIVVANVDVDGGQRYWPQENWASGDDRFEKVADSLDMSIGKQMAMYRKVAARTNF